MADKKKHLPMMGVGPIYGAVIIAVTVIAVIAGNLFFPAAVLFLLDFYDCADEMHGRKVVEKFVRQGI